MSDAEIAVLKDVALRAMNHSRGDSGPIIFDLVSGALTYDKQFIDLYAFLEKNSSCLFLPFELDLVKTVVQRVKTAVIKSFNLVDGTKLHVTSPLFMSQISARPAVTAHDEYWHNHIDRQQYPGFVYTGLLYLNTFDDDFKGGEFVFVDQEKDKPDRSFVVEPKAKRLNLFTSGPENPHKVLKVSKGVRFAMTMAFTCHGDAFGKAITVESLGSRGFCGH